MTTPEPIAIIGMGAILPDALDVPTAWENFLAGHSAVAPVPEELWDLNVGLDESRRDIQTSYSKVAAAIRGFQFRPADFGLPPVVAKSMDPVQKAALMAAREALSDAGITGPTEGLEAAVILGNLQGGAQSRGECWFKTSHKTLELTLKNLPAFQLLPPEAQEGFLQELRAAWFDQFLTNNSDALPGLLGNVAASRIAHHYNFHGPAMVIDAACASSLAALEQAVAGLHAGRFDLAITGGADLQMDLPSYAGFCAMGALSPDGSRPFDAEANGFVMGEGAVVFVLKRLSDARRDGDRVYASICAIGSSSDGRGRSIVAPNPAGQVRAMRKAYDAAGVKPEQVGYLEAHGTATPLGDPTEVEAVREVFGAKPTGSLPMGSAKGNLGHLKGAAGGAGLLRAALTLYHQTVPPQAGFKTPNPHCDFEHSPVHIPTAAEAFVGDERYAAVSAFGFGGINYHVVLRSGDVAPPQHTRTSLPLDLNIVALGANSREELLAQLQQYVQEFSSAEVLARHSVARPDPASYPVRLAFFADTDDDARKKLELAVSTLTKGGSAVRLEAAGILLREHEETFGPDQVVFMSPGQGSQYVGMLNELKERYAVVADTLAEADDIMSSVLEGKLSDYISPPEGKDPNEAFMDLLRTEVLQPAMLTCDEALRRLISQIVTPRALLGHSLGEYGALIGAGVIDFADALRIVAARGEAMEEVSLDDNGMMLAVGTDVATVEKAIEGIEGYLAVVNKNCPSQTILGGATPAIQAAQEKLQAQGLDCLLLPVSHAFHSDIVAPASAPLRRALDRISVRAPKLPILSNVTGDFYPSEESPQTQEWIRATLAKQVAAPVEFIQEVETAYASGARVFIEVGPKRAQAGFVKDILKGRPHRAMPMVHPKIGELEQLGRTVATLVVDGVVPYGRKRLADTIEVRPPFVGTAEASALTQQALQAQREQEERVSQLETALAQAQAALAQAQAERASAPQTSHSSGFDAVASDPGFWQFVGLQGPALMRGLAASYQAARAMQQQPHGFPWAAVPANWAGAESPPVGVPAAQPLPPAAAAPAPATTQPPPQASSSALLGGTLFNSAVAAEVAEPPAGTKPAGTNGKSNGKHSPSSGDHPSGMLGQPAPETPAPEVAAPAPASGAPSPDDDLAGWVLSRVADITGYQVEELDLDAHLEAELGIDSIRQIEIILGLRDELKLPKDDGFKVSDYPNLRSLIDYLETRRPKGNASKQASASF